MAPRPAAHIRPVELRDHAAWLSLWESQNAFYGREGNTALPSLVTHTTWARFFDPAEQLRALVAERQGELVGLAHYLYHRSTMRLESACYLHDLFILPAQRRLGIGKALIHAVYAQAARDGAYRVYWLTPSNNTIARALYEQVAEHRDFAIYHHGL